MNVAEKGRAIVRQALLVSSLLSPLQSSVQAEAANSPLANADQFSFPAQETVKTELTYTEDSSKWKVATGYTSDFTRSEKYRVDNIIAGSNGLNNYFWYFEEIDGKLVKHGKNVIKPGESFSINSVLEGVEDYVWGKAIGPNQESIDMFGGGICQIPTTMNVVSLKGGLSAEDRANHSYYNGWYFGDPNDSKEFGMDATILIPGQDLVVRNTYDYPIRFFFQIVEGQHLRAEIYGPPELKPYHVDPLIPRFKGRIPQLQGENRPVKDARRYPWAVTTVVIQSVWRDESKKELLFTKSLESKYQRSPYG